jgi:hypothetical protein
MDEPGKRDVNELFNETKHCQRAFVPEKTRDAEVPILVSRPRKLNLNFPDRAERQKRRLSLAN